MRLDGVSKTGAALFQAELAIEFESGKHLKKIEEYLDQLKQQEHYYAVRFKNALSREDEIYLSIADRIHGEIILIV